MIAAMLKRVQGWLPRGRFARNVGVLAGGLIFSQGLLVLISPLLTRLYGPEDFGVFTVYASMLSILLVVGSWLYELAIPLPSEEGEAANLLVLSLLIVVKMALLCGAGLWLFGGVFVGWLGEPGLQPYLWLLPLSLLGAGAYQALNMWATRMQAYGAVAKTKMHQSIGAAGAQIGFGLAVGGAFGLLAGDAVSRMFGGTTLARLALKGSGEAVRGTSWQGMWAMAKRYRRFPLLSAWPTLMNAMLLQVPAFLLTASYGTEVVGWYALAQRVLGLPLFIIGTAVSQVYMGEASRIAQEDRGAVARLFWRTAKSLVLVGLPLMLVMAWAAPWCFGVVFGGEWQESGVYVRALSAMFFLQLVTIPLGSNLVVFERQDLHLLREVIRLVLMGAVVAIVLLAHLSPLRAVLLLSASGALGYLVHAFLSWWAMRS